MCLATREADDWRHERAGIVHQHFLRHAAEGRECALDPNEPVFLLRDPEHTRMQPWRMPERRRCGPN